MLRMSNSSQLFYEQIKASIEEQGIEERLDFWEGLSELISSHIDYLKSEIAKGGEYND